MAHKELEHLFINFFKQVGYGKALNLSTVDGFTVLSQTIDGYELEADKLSAVTSSLASLSNAAAQQLIQSQLLNTTIETDNGDLIILKTQYHGKSAILCVITDKQLSLGKSRYYSIKLAEAIANLPT